jgi:hypothetical protein
LIQIIYEVDPLTCFKCQGQMRKLAFIENEDVIKKILKHFGGVGSIERFRESNMTIIAFMQVSFIST